MPAIQTRAPSWLSKGGYGAQLFQLESQPLGEASQGQQSTDGRTHVPSAARGNEIFFAVDNTIRWADLSRVKETAEESSGGANPGQKLYRTLNLKRSFPEPIQQLVVSPNEDLLAIVTNHSVSVIVLPDVSLLHSEDRTPVNVRRHTIGETTHVRETPAIAKVLWHPLGLDGNCLVTITVASVVRLWELDRRNLASFSVPSLAIDLVKLRYARSQEEDTSSRDMNYNKTFSIDNVEMEVTGACFGSNASEAQAFEWSSTTLWLTMAEGDIFALCPLLPSRFQVDDDGTIPTLFELKSAEKESLDAIEAFGLERARVQAHCAWLGELQEQYDNFEDNERSSLPPRRTYFRPRSQGALPKLQGPFVILPNEAQDDLMPCDIHVIGANTAASLANDYSEADSDEELDHGVSYSIVSVLDANGRVYICLDIDGVQPQWLPVSKPLTATDDIAPPAELLLFEALDTLKPSDLEFEQSPVFTGNTTAEDYSFFVSHRKGIYKFSLEPWVREVEKEVQAEGTTGVQFRTQVLTKGPGTQRECLYRADQEASKGPASIPVLLSTEEIGHLLLTVQDQQPHAVLFSSPGAEDEPALLEFKPSFAPDAKNAAIPQLDRDTYHPPPAFSQTSNLSAFLEKSVEPRYKRMLKEEIRLSPATLAVMTQAHRVLSKETTALNDAAANLFRRCDRLHEEFKHQIERMSDVADQILRLGNVDTGSASVNEKSVSRNKDVEERLSNAAARQTTLLKRHDALRQKLARAGGKPLSGKEKAWVAEVTKIDASIGSNDEKAQNSAPRQSMLQRFEEVHQIATEMLGQAKRLDGEDKASNGSTNGYGNVPPSVHRGKIGEVEMMLEKETALIDVAIKKLARLGVSSEA